MEQGLRNVLWFFAKMAAAILASILIVVGVIMVGLWAYHQGDAIAAPFVGIAVLTAMAIMVICLLFMWALQPILAHKK